MFNIFNRTPRRPTPLPFHTDIHCHILPGVDDGSPDIPTSVRLVSRLADLGITRIIASPHVTQDTFENTPPVLDSALDDLRRALADAGITMPVARSAEYRLDEYFASQLAAGAITPLPGNHILVENSFIQEPWGLDKILFDLKIKGYKPILAHPERYLYYSGSARNRYRQLHDAGTLFQVNILSLTGHYGKTERDTARHLLDNGWIDFLGTDLHNEHHADIIADYLTSRDAARTLPRITPLNDTL